MPEARFFRRSRSLCYGMTLPYVALRLILAFTFASTMVASPLNDVLAERTESRATPPLTPVTGTGLAHQLRLIWIDLVKTIAATAAGVVAILFSWIPVVNIVAFLAVFLLVCFQYTSYPQTRRRERLGAGSDLPALK